MDARAVMLYLKDPDSRKLIVVVSAAIILGLVVYIGLAMQSAGQETVVFSNGKKVQLGQSRQSVVKELGSSLRPVQNYYAYVNGNTKEVEALIYLYHDRISAVRVNANANNAQKRLGVHVGVSAKAIETSQRAKLDNLNPTLDKFKLAGYRYVGSRSVIYMLTDRCQPTDTVLNWVIAFKGQESLGLGRVKIAKCNVGV